MAKSVRYEGERDAKVEDKDTLKLFRAAQLGQALPGTMPEQQPQAPQDDLLVTKTQIPDRTEGLTGQEISDQFWEEHNALMANQTLTPEQRSRLKNVVVPLDEGKAQRQTEAGPPDGKSK